jgi:hypothetical protein
MSYDSRNNELTDRYTALIGKVTFEETMRMKTALDAYTQRRSDLLPSLVLQVTSTTDLPIKDSWGPKLQDTRKALDDILKGMLDSVSKPSAEALAFQGQARVEDDSFFSGLAAAKLDTARDGILTVATNLTAYIAILDAKWSSMTDKDKEIEQQEEQLMRELNDSTKQSIDEGNTAFNKAGPVVADTVERTLNFYKSITSTTKAAIADYLKKMGDGTEVSKMNADMWALFFVTAFDPGKWVQSMLQPTLDTNLQAVLDALAGQVRAGLPLVNGFFAERVMKMRNLVPNQNAVLVIFSDTRKEADDFVRNHGLDVAKSTYEDVSSGLDSWVSAQKGANATDASAIKTDMLNRFSARVGTLADAFNEFVRNYNGKFFSTVSSDVERQFINSAFWEDSQRQVDAWDLEAKLRLYYDGLNKFLPDLQSAFGQLSDNISELPVAVQDVFKTKVTEAQRAFLDTISAKIEEAKANVDNARNTARSSDVKQVIDRRPLQAVLRG